MANETGPFNLPGTQPLPRGETIADPWLKIFNKITEDGKAALLAKAEAQAQEGFWITWEQLATIKAILKL